MFWDNWFGSRTKKEVMLLRPNDGHFSDIRVDEKDKAFISPKIKGVTRFFLKKKGSKGWTNDKGGGSRYFGLEGYDFTLKIGETQQSVLNLLEAVKIVLEDLDFNKFTPSAKTALESARFCVTTEPVTTEGVDKLNEGNENAFSEADMALIKAKGEATAKAGKTEKLEFIQIIMGVMVGIIIGLLLVNYKVFKLG